MTPSKIKNLPESILARLRNQAHASGRPLNELLQYYAIERFLYRLSQSAYAGRFVLKGALMFLVWGTPVYRPTRDIDLLSFTGNSVDHVVQLIKEIGSQPIEPDGLVFPPESVQGERIKEDADYEGVRVKLIGRLGKARIPQQIDLGFDDIVSPAPILVEYPSLLAMPRALLRGYPRETVIAEKLQAMIYLGTANSRMKDFYDLWVLSQRFDFQLDPIRQSIRETFRNRGTIIPSELPIAFSESFAVEKQAQWESFLKRNRLGELPEDFRQVIQDLQNFLWMPLQMARQGDPSEFELTWKNGAPWKKSG